MTPNLPGYQISESIYEGTRTLVYRGIRVSDSLRVAIKFLRNEYPSFSELVQFRNQYAITKNLNLTGIVQPLSLERSGNGYALVMEDLGAISLDKTLAKNESLDLESCLEIAIQLADILQELDRNRIIHKDIKPANILIQPETKDVQLIDFSIASLLPKEAQEIKNFNVLEGTLAYISPEQTGRMNRGIDYRSDFYGLGVTLYELLTGTLPFSSDDPMELVHCHISQQPVPPAEVEARNPVSPEARNPVSPEARNPVSQRNRVSEIPPVVSDIVMKLMAKNAEDRYQSALGLKYDLEKCLQQWQAQGKIEPFELATRDIAGRFLIPEKLYGREAEVSTLLAAFDRVAKGPTEMMLVAGFSGIGKTVVVNEVHKPIVRQRGYFIKGKFDQFNRNIPLSAFIQAFRNLMGQLLGESDAELQQWKEKILEAVGVQGQVLIEVIPELDRIIGEQPPAPELSGSAAQNRFNLLFEKLIAVFTTREHPLTIFVDDLQWADSASLNLMKLLMGDSQRGYLLLLGAYRDNEVFPGHPLMLSLAELEKQQTTISTITLAPLSVSHINQLVAETLSCPVELAAPLTDLVYQKTQGNPFFTTQFLKGLHEDGLIAFNPNWGYWECDLVKVQDAALTSDVVEFMASRLHKLPSATQKVLKLGACIGNQFDLETLAIICAAPSSEVAADLWNALREGLILPQSQAYKFFQEWDQEDARAESITVGYRFLHDRVQQAAYTLIPQEMRGAKHLDIGRSLLASLSPETVREQVLEIVRHFNVEPSLLTTPEEKMQVVQLNQLAGEKAKRSAAYSAVIDYFNRGMALLGNDPWQQQRELAFYFSNNIAEAAFLSGDFAKAISFISTIKQEADNILEEIKAWEIEIQIAQARHEQVQCLKIGLSVLQQLGVELPEYPTPEDVQLQLQYLDTALAGIEVGDIAKSPPMQNPEIEAAMAIMASVMTPAYQARTLLFQMLALRQLQLTLQWGLATQTPFACAIYGLILSRSWLDVERGYQFGELGIELLEQPGMESVKSTTRHLFYIHIHSIKYPARASLQPGLESALAGIEAGEYQYSGFTISLGFMTAYFAGVELHVLERDLETYREVLKQCKQEITLQYHSILQQAVANLRSSNASIDLIGEFYNEEESVPGFSEKGDNSGIAFSLGHKLALCCLFEEVPQGIEVADELENYIGNLAGVIFIPTAHFYNCLLRLKQAERQIAPSQEITGESLAKITGESFQKSFEELGKFAACTPVNYEHKLQLVEAERDRLLGQKLEAIELYDRAIAGAKENKYLHEEALANELAAKFYLDWGKEKTARTYMTDAYYGYARWGAKAKTDQLEEKYPQLLAPILQQPRNPVSERNRVSGATLMQTESSTSTTAGSMLDWATAMKAAQSLSSEIHLDKLVSALMKAAMENAGADGGILLLQQSEGWQVAARCSSVANCDFRLTEVSDNLDLPTSVINQVKRRQEPIIVNDFSRDTQFAGDPYLLQGQPKSFLCAPILNQGKLIGILYLENHLATGAFTSDRLEVLELLSAQAAISLENARLYQRLEEYSHTLEAQVESRTQELNEQNQELQSTLEQLQRTQLQLIQTEKMSSLGQMVAGVAHEINNPITFIAGNITYSREHFQTLIELLELYSQEFPDPGETLMEKLIECELDFVKSDMEQILSSMQNGSDRIRNIVLGLRNFSRLDESGMKQVDIHQGLDNTLMILQHRLSANDNRGEIQVIKKYGKLPEVNCYASQLNQVFLNIITNAIDALEAFDSQGSARPEIRISTEVVDSQTIKIRMADNGAGMSESILRRVFDPFFTTKPVGQGTGLGLSTSYQIVTEQHGGQLHCFSEPGKGTEFVVEIPVKE
jgi:predicted ATPase/signal transduction histidine kinase/serine/threonine protein kinase